MSRIRANIRLFCLFIIGTFTLFFFQNCGRPGLNSKSASSTERSDKCKAQPHSLSPFEKSKVQISEHTIRTQNEAVRKMSLAESKLALVVDPICLDQSQNPVRVLGQTIRVLDKRREMQRAAISLVVRGEIDQEQLENEMEQSPCLIGITENPLVTLDGIKTKTLAKSETLTKSATLNDPRANQQDHLFFTRLRASLGLQNQITEPVVVAVVDSGITNHRELRGQLWQNSDGENGRNTIEQNNNIEDRIGHGTHVTGIIAAKQNNNYGVAGLNGDFVRIMVIKAFKLNDDGKVVGSFATIYDGIQYAIENDADIINLSVSISIDPEQIIPIPKMINMIRGIVGEAINEGIVVTMAAGNGKEKNKFVGQLLATDSFCTSACVGPDLPGALSVASVDTNTNQISRFSHFSRQFVEIAAPGAENSRVSSQDEGGILSTVGNGFDRLWGTSMATPVVTAAAAFVIGYLKTHNIRYTPRSVEEFLTLNGSRNVDALLSKVKKGRLIDFSLISQNLRKMNQLISNNDNRDPGESETPLGNGNLENCL